LTQKRAAAPGDKPSLISWRQWKDIELKGDPKGVVAEGDALALRVPLTSIFFRALAPPKKSMGESDLNPVRRSPSDAK
jgi:hypothetical protein